MTLKLIYCGVQPRQLAAMNCGLTERTAVFIDSLSVII